VGTRGGAHNLSYTGAWSVFRMFHDADRFDPQGTGYLVEWALPRGATLPDGSQAKVLMEVNFGGAAPVVRRDFFAGASCASEVVR
jgi:hypothetical protein